MLDRLEGRGFIECTRGTAHRRKVLAKITDGLQLLATVNGLAIALECDVTDLVDVFNGRDLRKLIPKRK